MALVSLFIGHLFHSFIPLATCKDKVANGRVKQRIISAVKIRIPCCGTMNKSNIVCIGRIVNRCICRQKPLPSLYILQDSFYMMWHGLFPAQAIFLSALILPHILRSPCM